MIKSDASAGAAISSLGDDGINSIPVVVIEQIPQSSEAFAGRNYRMQRQTESAAV